MGYLVFVNSELYSDFSKLYKIFIIKNYASWLSTPNVETNMIRIPIEAYVAIIEAGLSGLSTFSPRHI